MCGISVNFERSEYFPLNIFYFLSPLTSFLSFLTINPFNVQKACRAGLCQFGFWNLFLLFNPKEFGLFWLLRMGGGTKCPMAFDFPWRLQSSCKFKNQHFIWELWCLQLIWYPVEVSEAVSLASRGRRTDQWQKEKNHRWKFGICQFLS